MLVITTLEEIEKLKCREPVKLKCEYCSAHFFAPKNQYLATVKSIKNNGRWKNSLKFCSKQCLDDDLNSKRYSLCKCKNCNSEFQKQNKEIKKTKNHFCSHSCAATYNNTHKTKGTRISKLEKWLQTKLIEIYPNQNIIFNGKESINSELDIHFKDLNLAFELNGIFHYEPIYGENKLNQIKNNDNRKYQACIENGIELCIIDTSQQIYFKESTSIKYLDIIKNIVDTKISS